MYVDACTLWMVKNPEFFDTVVTTNLFGDIITDLGAMLQGGLGIAAGGNINPGKVSMFEPIHGSAPKYKGQHKANPLAAINAMGMLLDHVGRPEEAALIESAVGGLLATKRVASLQTGAMPCDKIGDLVANEVRVLAGDKPRKSKREWKVAPRKRDGCYNPTHEGRHAGRAGVRHRRAPPPRSRSLR